MKRLVAAVIVALLAGSAVAQFVDYYPPRKPDPSDKIGLTPKEFDAIKAGLEKDAGGVLVGLTPDVDALRAIRDVGYNKDTWKMVEPYLKSLADGSHKLALKDPNGKDLKVEECHRLYLICLWTEPLIKSKADVIHAAVPTLRDIEGKYCAAYKAYPPCSAAVLAKCKMPDKPPTGAARISIPEAVVKARNAKSAKEQPITLLNQYIGEVEQNYCLALAFAEDPVLDKELVGWVVDNEEKHKNYVWVMGLEVAELGGGFGRDD